MASNRARQSRQCHPWVLRPICVPVSARSSVPVLRDSTQRRRSPRVLNYVTAYQMLHRSAKAQPGQRMRPPRGTVGSAMLQLARLVGVWMFGTCSAQGASVVRELGGVPIDYRNRGLREGGLSARPAAASTLCSTASAETIYGAPAPPCARAVGWWGLWLPVESSRRTHDLRRQGP